MDVRHFLKIYDDNGNGGVVRIIRSRSFDDINFKRFYQGENKFGLVSILREKVEFSPNEILHLENENAYEHNYEFQDEEDKEERKARLVSENQELPWAMSEMGELANICGRVVIDNKNIGQQIARFNKAILKNSNDEVIDEVSLENGGLTLKEIDDFCNAVHAVHSKEPYLNFSQITEQLLSSSEGQEFAKNYENLAKILRKIGKFKNIKSRNAQLTFDLFGNITPDTKNVKQRDK